MTIVDTPSRIILVTGASRGAGKGIALALAQPHSIIYITGRSEAEGNSPLPGTIYDTAELINQRGAKGIAVKVDHANDDEVQALIEKIQQEQGRLDILVNNACAIPEGLVDKKPFWEKGLHQLDIMNVGMRSHYTTTFFAAPLLLRQSEQEHPALVVHTSSAGGRCYMHGPAYGGGKAAVDKFANDMAVDFRPFNVACVSIWMGLLRTERTLQLIEAEPDKYGGIADMSESPEFTGRVINALYNDTELMKKTGQILVAAEEAVQYGVLDIDGRQPPSPTGFLGHPAQANPAIVE
jgi:NAD(P)-dependent dehydrogenase (short-subunit alcohol dehydrogenase family)